MARVTVEDCLKVVKNRFSLAMLAGYRAREISKGSEIMVNKDNDKDAVIALREIAEGFHNIDNLEAAFTKSLQSSAQAEDLIEEVSFKSDIENSPYAASDKVERVVSSKSDTEEEFISVEDYDFEDDVSSED